MAPHHVYVQHRQGCAPAARVALRAPAHGVQHVQRMQGPGGSAILPSGGHIRVHDDGPAPAVQLLHAS